MTDWRSLTAGVQKSAKSAFGTPALYRVAGLGVGVAVRGIWRDASVESEAGLEEPAVTMPPVFHVRKEDLPAGALDEETDTIELADPPAHIPLLRQYRIHDDDEDGEGMILLLLTRETPSP